MKNRFAILEHCYCSCFRRSVIPKMKMSSLFREFQVSILIPAKVYWAEKYETLIILFIVMWTFRSYIILNADYHWLKCAGVSDVRAMRSQEVT